MATVLFVGGIGMLTNVFAVATGSSLVLAVGAYIALIKLSPPPPNTPSPTMPDVKRLFSRFTKPGRKSSSG